MTDHCPTCRNPDGSPDEDYLYEACSCAHGCGQHINMDHGLCTSCGDHSANEGECETCGTEWADWTGSWQPKKSRTP